MWGSNGTEFSGPLEWLDEDLIEGVSLFNNQSEV